MTNRKRVSSDIHFDVIMVVVHFAHKQTLNPYELIDIHSKCHAR